MRLFNPKLRVPIEDNNSLHGKFHRFLFPFSSKFPFLYFSCREIYFIIEGDDKIPGGTALYLPYRYVPPHRVEFLRHFGLKRGTDFEHFGLGF